MIFKGNGNDIFLRNISKYSYIFRVKGNGKFFLVSYFFVIRIVWFNFGRFLKEMKDLSIL